LTLFPYTTLFRSIIVVHNSGETTRFPLPAGNWNIAVQGDKAGNRSLGVATGSVLVDAKTTTVLYLD
jgi:hypothetical protein